MTSAEKLRVLAKIAAELEREKVEWALGGSAMLYLRGIVEAFHDFDLMVFEADAQKAAQVLDRLGMRQQSAPCAKYRTAMFREYRIDGVDADMIAGFAIAAEDGRLHDCSLKKESAREARMLEGVRIPLDSAEAWERYYRLMGREAKAETIRAARAEDEKYKARRTRLQAVKKLSFFDGGDPSSEILRNFRREERSDD